MNYTDREARRSVELDIQMKDFSFIKTTEESSLNLSPGGAFIKMDEPYPSGTLVKFKILTPDNTVIDGVGKVAWFREKQSNGQAPPGVGIKFLKMSDESRSVLEKILENAEIIVSDSNTSPIEKEAVTKSVPVMISEPNRQKASEIERQSTSEHTLQLQTTFKPVKPVAGPSKTAEAKDARVIGNMPSVEIQTPIWPRPETSPKTRSAIPWILGIVIAAAIAVGAWVLMGKSGTQTPTETKTAPTEERAVPQEEVKATPTPAPTPTPTPTPTTEAAAAPVEEAVPKVESISVDVSTSPPGATISVNGKPEEGVTPLKLNLEKGKEAEITAGIAGYMSQSVKVPAAENIPPININLVPARIKFQITSKPSGARIVIDGKFNGSTPFTFLRKKYKEYNYRIEKKGYKSIEGTITKDQWVEKDGKYYVFTLDAVLTPK